MGRFGEGVNIIVDSGQTLSAPFFLGGGADRLVILTPSRSPAAAVFFQVGPSSAGPFGRSQRPDGAAGDYLVATSATTLVAGVVWPMPPGTHGRVEMGAAATAVNTFTVIGGVSR